MVVMIDLMTAGGCCSMLIKALARIIKVEKNNESVIHCQQLLSTRLDKVSHSPPFATKFTLLDLGRDHERLSRNRHDEANHPGSCQAVTCSKDAEFTTAGQQGAQLLARVFLNHHLVTDWTCLHKGMC